MPDLREAADNPVGRDAIRPVASPVDTFVRPGGDSGLSQLAESLKGIAPEVSKYSDVAAAQQSATQKAQGEQKARDLFDSGTSYKDAIKKGLISPQESPWFQLGAKEQFGRVTAGKYSADLALAVAGDPTLQQSTDTADYDKFAQNFKKQWTADNVGDQKGLQFDNSFGKLSEEYNKDERMKFADEAGKRLVKQVNDNHYAEVFQMLDHETSMHTDPKAMAQAWNLINDRAIASGMNPRAANLAGIKALGDIVDRDGDTTMFDLLKQVKTGSGSLYATAAAQEEIQKVTQKVFTEKQEQARGQWDAQTRARETAVRSSMSSIYDRLSNSANPARENIEPELAALGKLDAHAADEMRSFRNNIIGEKFSNNTNSVTGATAAIFDKTKEGEPGYVDVHTLVGLLNSHEINEQGFTELKSQIDKRDEAARIASHEHNVYTDPQFLHALSTTKTLIGNEFDFSKPGDQQRIAGATAEFGKYWLEYAASPAFKTATPTDKHEFLVNTQKLVVNKWRTADTKTETAPTPSIDLSTPRQRQINRTMATQIEFERGNKSYSPNSIAFMRANGLHTDADITAFVNKNRKQLP